MKNIYYIVLILVFNACVSMSPKQEPNWTRRNYIDTNSSQFVYINDLTEHRDIIRTIEYEEIDTYTDSVGFTYTLYRFNKSDIKKTYDTEINNSLIEVKQYIRDGKSTYKLIEKNSFFKHAKYLLLELEPIMYIYERYDIKSDIILKDFILEVDALLDKTMESFTIKINTSPSSPDYLQSMLEEVLTLKGFNTSDLGVIELQADLTLKEIDLDNGYENIMWYLNIKTIESNGDIIDSKMFQGRESHLELTALEQIVYTEVYKKLINDKDEIFSEF